MMVSIAVIHHREILTDKRIVKYKASPKLNLYGRQEEDNDSWVSHSRTNVIPW